MLCFLLNRAIIGIPSGIFVTLSVDNIAKIYHPYYQYFKCGFRVNFLVSSCNFVYYCGMVSLFIDVTFIFDHVERVH
jgi:hypothetical protein